MTAVAPQDRESAPVSAQRRSLDAPVATLRADQAAWLSGYAAALARARTGVASHRASRQEHDGRDDGTRCWLVFGDRSFGSDFLYRTDWQALPNVGVRRQAGTAFSRDGADGRTCVRQRQRAQARGVFAWLKDGAHVFLCGDASSLAPGVHGALLEILQQEAGIEPQAAAAYLAGLRRNRRHRIDVY